MTMKICKHFNQPIVFEKHKGYLDTKTNMVMFYGRVFDTINHVIPKKSLLEEWKTLSK